MVEKLVIKPVRLTRPWQFRLVIGIMCKMGQIFATPSYVGLLAQPITTQATTIAWWLNPSSFKVNITRKVPIRREHGLAPVKDI